MQTITIKNGTRQVIATRNTEGSRWRKLQDRERLAFMGDEKIKLVQDWITSDKLFRQLLREDGPREIAKATRRMSLRELARLTGLSPTYLSQVATKKIAISPEAFLKVCRVSNENL